MLSRYGWTISTWSQISWGWNCYCKFEKVEIASSDDILAELVQAGSEILLSATHKLINYIQNKEELPDQWKESVIVPVHKKSDKTDCNNYCVISLLSTSYKILLNILLSMISPYIDEIIGVHQCGFRHSRSTADQIFCIRHILEKKWEYNEIVH
jgi:hypothetical protein